MKLKEDGWMCLVEWMDGGGGGRLILLIELKTQLLVSFITVDLAIY